MAEKVVAWWEATTAAAAVGPLTPMAAGDVAVAAAASGEAIADAAVLYGAHFCLRASRRSFFCCIIRRRLSSLDLVLEFSSSAALMAAAQRWQCCGVGAGAVDVVVAIVSGRPHLHSTFGLAAFGAVW